jgi:hypothetical protein
MNGRSKSTTSKPPARAGGRILPSELPEHVAEDIAKLAGVPPECWFFCDYLRDRVWSVWEWDRRAGSSEPGEALKRAAKAARTLREAVGSLNKADREWVEKLLKQDHPYWSEELVNRPPGRYSLAPWVPDQEPRLGDLSVKVGALAALFSTAANQPAAEMAGSAKLRYKSGRRKGAVKDETFHDLVFSLLSNAAEWGGALPLDKSKNFKKEGGALAEALEMLRPYLPKGVIPEKLPLMTLQRIKTQHAKAQRSLLERPELKRPTN